MSTPHDERPAEDADPLDFDDAGSYYSNDEQASEDAEEIGRKQGPGAESPGSGAGGPGARSQKSRGG